MNVLTLVRRSLRFHWRSHLGVALGAACATAVLVGALAIGDSVRASLREQALARIGRIDAVLAGGERLFGADLADRLAPELPGAALAPALQLGGVATTASGARRAGIVDVLGVDERFFALGPAGSPLRAPAAGQAFVNERLAAQLAVDVGDAIVLRVERPSLLPREGTMATIEDVSFALRVEVAAVLGDEAFGRFGLRASQIPPFDVFVALPWLQQQVAMPGRANLLAAAGAGGADFVARADAALRARWSLADAGLHLREYTDPGQSTWFELTSDRVFLDPPVAEAAAGVEPGLLGVLTWFVRELRAGERATPYSTVSALGLLRPDAEPAAPAIAEALALLPPEVGADGIVLNDWTAADLAVRSGDRVELTYFVMDPQLRLSEQSHAFTVRAVVPMRGLAADPDLMPAFPGLEDSERCSEWDPGIPIDLDKIRDVDEEYWNEHRGTPKAFVPLRVGQELWRNRFGSLTAIRGPQAMAAPFAEALRGALAPDDLGLFFRDVRGPALGGAVPATDFGGLYLGLSFFLIAAAVLLTALLFVFGVEQRAAEVGTLLAVGFRRTKVRLLFLTEALALLALGAVPGALLGLGYTRGVLWALETIWQDSVGATSFTLHASAATLALGSAIAGVTGLAAIATAMRRLFRRPAVELLASRAGIRVDERAGPGRARASIATAVIAIGLAGALATFAGTGAGRSAGAFFGAGALLLIGMLGACRWLLARLARADERAAPLHSRAALALRNAGRRPGRSLATIALLASGVFLVVAIQAHRLLPPADATARASGTGGFALFGRSTLPVLRDLGTADGRAAYGLDGDLAGVSFVPLRMREGDDASCLNLNVPPNPRLLGVRPRDLAERGAFRFVDVLPTDAGAAPANPWLLLDDAEGGDDVVPAFGDQGSIRWVLHKQLGDTIDYRDERGRAFKVRIIGTLAGSILQGDLVISDRAFQRRFPSTSGHRVFLVDAPPAAAERVAERLTGALGDLGFEATPTIERLQTFQAVQNSYLMIFTALGALGLLLGSAGLGIVVLRNVLERRGELALLRAVGFEHRLVRRLVATEHLALLGLGLGSGLAAALLALQAGAGEGMSLTTTILPFVAVLASGLCWVLAATAFALRGPMFTALQSE